MVRLVFCFAFFICFIILFTHEHVNFLVFPQLIFTVRSSGAPHNPNSVFTTAVDGSRGNTREGNNTPDDNTKEILKVPVLLLYTMTYFSLIAFLLSLIFMRVPGLQSMHNYSYRVFVQV